ncbi:hypothetical protein TIFTF001_009346 [Ficus carica]|uniref:Uncharacterized protein n=1 Tax=Ficus carica TaxID=3494 RepID=A0AA88D187_FICCA|nr:hypothetical protein TIFTF001_009346 [Ficus carica]
MTLFSDFLSSERAENCGSVARQKPVVSSLMGLQLRNGLVVFLEVELGLDKEACLLESWAVILGPILAQLEFQRSIQLV